MRIRNVTSAFAVLVMLSLPALCADVEFVTPKVNDSITKALSYLKRIQSADGAWGSASQGRNPAITALATMALMAEGNLPGRGKYGANVERGIKYLMRSVDPGTGFIGGAGGQMYAHGFATLALAEAYGMMPSEELRRKLQLAIRCIVRSQKSDGGWRYDPAPQGESDLSVTICQMMALRAANNAGIHVSKSTIDRAVRYTKQSANPDGGFRYMLRGGGSSFPLTGAGVTCLYGAGAYDSKEAKNGLAFLQKFFTANPGQGRYAHYFYGHYYAVQAMYQAGGKHWDFWYPRIRDELLRTQMPDGSWQAEIDPAYGTAMAALILQVPYNYLPIFQR